MESLKARRWYFLLATLMLCVCVNPVFAGTGGHVAQEGEAPWFTAVVRGRQDEAGGHPVRFVCGGALVHPQWVATAAHCVASATDRGFQDLSVAVGITDLSRLGQEETELVEVEEVVANPWYLFSRSGEATGDLALLRLKRPILKVAPVELIDSSIELPPGAQVSMFGWGQTEASGTLSEALHRIDFNEVAIGDARESWLRQGVSLGADALSFGRNDGSLGSCGGDSGGPVVVRTSRYPDRWMLVGILSLGARPCASEGFYTVATSIRHHWNWIQGWTHPEFHEWLAESGLASGFADPDGDQISNFEEFAFALRPTAPDWSSILRIRGAGGATGRKVVVSFARNREPTGLTYELQHSSDLMQWDQWNTVSREDVDIQSEVDNERELVTIEMRTEQSGARSGNFRIAPRLAPRERPLLFVSEQSPGFYIEGLLTEAASTRADGGNRFVRELELANLVAGKMVTMFYLAEGFSPRLRIIEVGSGASAQAAGMPGEAQIELAWVPEEGKRYRMELSSVEESATGRFRFHYPRMQLTGGGTELPLGAPVIQGQLDAASDFDGSFYSDPYVLTGAKAGDLVRIDLKSEALSGGFHPFVAVLNQGMETVAVSRAVPLSEAAASFVVKAGETYFVFATTLEPGRMGFYSIAARVGDA